MQRRPRLTRRDWKKVVAQTVVFTGIGIAVSLAASHILLSTFSGGLDATGAAAAILMPIVLGGPMTFYLSLKNGQLDAAYRLLETAAARDSLTNCLNHGAFLAQTNDVLLGAEPENAAGALLVVDADSFKMINDRFGHHVGDVALRLIAARIRGAVRKGDIVGRLGGEEFGVLLPGATLAMAETIAESMRRAVQSIVYEVEGVSLPLSVSIGGATFDGPVSYGELFRLADQRLYRAKDAGRNTIDLVEFAPTGQAPAAELRRAG